MKEITLSAPPQKIIISPSKMMNDSIRECMAMSSDMLIENKQQFFLN